MAKSIFFAYPSYPNAVREPAARGADLIAGTGLVDTVPWESLRVGGRFIIDEITGAISSADVTACVVTLLNQNVMFELGFAIGAGRPIWLLLDPSHKEADRRWQHFRILSTVGYSPYVSGEDIQAEFLKDRPELNREPLVDHIPLEPSSRSSVFYVKALYRTDADVGLTRIVYEIESRGLHVIAADPDEGNVYPLTWYAQQVYASEATVIHFTSEQRTGALVHNARCALVAGIAHGMQRPLLMLAETDYYSPIDYRDALHVYSSANDCKLRARSWLGQVSVVPPDVQEARIERIQHLRLATELASLRLGEDVAEQESDRLSDYFIETYSYRQVLERRTTVFVGRKGTGKTANLLRAMAELGADRRNLVVVIKPQSYEIEAVLALLGRYGGRETRSHVVNALWQYLLYTEVARAAAASIRNMPAGEAGASEPERALLAFFDDPQHSLGEEFAIRLERMALRLAEQELPAGIEASRDMVLETLHADELRKLRALLGDALQRWNRVAVLVDNLDKGWDRAADVAQLAHLLLGLLSALGEVADEFGKKDHWRRAVDLTLAAFLRSDIFYAVTRVAREPDKIPQSRLVWRDPQVLLRVVEERYLAGRDPMTDPSELWQRYFPATVGTRPIRDYLTWRTLPRPRDLLHLCNAAIAAAVDARNDRVTEEDLLRAEKQYSQFALEALRVENGITVLQLEDVLTGFLGLPPTMTEASVLDIIQAAGIREESSPEVLERLIGLSFLGVETNEGEFHFPEDPDGVKKADVLSSRLAERTQSPRRVQVHPAFRPYLEMLEE